MRLWGHPPSKTLLSVSSILWNGVMEHVPAFSGFSLRRLPARIRRIGIAFCDMNEALSRGRSNPLSRKVRGRLAPFRRACVFRPRPLSACVRYLGRRRIGRVSASILRIPTIIWGLLGKSLGRLWEG